MSTRKNTVKPVGEMREEYLHYTFWVIVIGSWVMGMAYGRWIGGGGVFQELGSAVSVPEPSGLEWWHPLAYFPLTVLASFLLSQMFFGMGAVLFMFCRGAADSSLFLALEGYIRTWTPAAPSMGPIWAAFFIVLVLVVNLPLCVWASHLGMRRANRMYRRLRGKPLQPEVGVITGLLLTLGASLLAGLMGALTLSYV